MSSGATRPCRQLSDRRGAMRGAWFFLSRQFPAKSFLKRDAAAVAPSGNPARSRSASAGGDLAASATERPATRDPSVALSGVRGNIVIRRGSWYSNSLNFFAPTRTPMEVVNGRRERPVNNLCHPSRDERDNCRAECCRNAGLPVRQTSPRSCRGASQPLRPSASRCYRCQERRSVPAVADGLHDRLGLRREDVFINLVEVPKENWSFGNGVAQYAS